MRFVPLVSLGLVSVGLMVWGFDEVAGPRPKTGVIAGSEAGYAFETSDSLSQPTSANIESIVSSLLPTAATTMRATAASGSESVSLTGDDLELREIIVTLDPDPSMQGRSQHPTVTTRWVPTILPDGVTTYVEVIFTQTFAGAPDPLPSPGEGRIGMDDESGGLVREVKAMSGAATTDVKDRKVMILWGLFWFWCLFPQIRLGFGFAGVVWL